MGSVMLMVGTAIGFIVAYNTYGKFIARKLFGLHATESVPAHEMEDGVDYVPTKPEVLFGHHFTSIAGTGPIVGPAIGIIWGWIPAVLWVIFGSIFIGAVHDLSAIVISERNQGRSIGEVAAAIINRRVRTIFLCIIFFLLLLVIAVFCLVIAKLFELCPQAVLPVWLQLPIALIVGHLIYRKNVNPLVASLSGVAALYGAIVLGAYFPWSMPTIGGIPPTISWTILLLIYVYFASVLPVWRLLQPRDYINGHQLFIAMAILALGVLAARPAVVAPAIQLHPSGAPPLWPLLFVTIACGAISGFHSLVGSGTTSKQLSNEAHALPIGYGSMLLEGMLAMFVIIAVAAGIGMAVADGQLSGIAAWQQHYSSWGAAKGLGPKVGAFITGAANMLTALGIPRNIGMALMGVFVASFAATTLDTSTRLQRYVIAELAAGWKIKALTNKHLATLAAVGTAFALAYPKGGTGGLLLFPLFGSVNQLLGCLALLVATLYLKKQGKPVIYTLIPMLFMLVMTGWAMVYTLSGFLRTPGDKWYLLVLGSIILLLEIWMVAESVVVFFSLRQGKENG